MALPEPITRKEMYLSKAATGEGNVPPEPVTREEMYLAEIANGGGGGSAEPFVVTFTVADMGSSAATTDKSFEEVKQAVEAGKTVYANIDFPNGEYPNLSFDLVNIPLAAIASVPGFGIGSFTFAMTAFLDKTVQNPFTVAAVIDAGGNIWWKSNLSF